MLWPRALACAVHVYLYLGRRRTLPHVTCTVFGRKPALRSPRGRASSIEEC